MPERRPGFWIQSGELAPVWVSAEVADVLYPGWRNAWPAPNINTLWMPCDDWTHHVSRTRQPICWFCEDAKVGYYVDDSGWGA